MRRSAGALHQNRNTVQVSIVSTLYCSERHLREFYTRCVDTVGQFTSDFELILVNDGSPDDSLELAKQLYREDNRVVIVDLSRNYGHHKALMRGMEEARGTLVFLIDSDLEEPPEAMQRLHARWEEANADCLYGVQEKRKGNAFEQWSGSLFYKVFNSISEIPVPENFLTLRLMSRRYVDALLEHRERAIFLGGLFVLTGFEQKPVVIPKASISPSTYTLQKKIALFLNSVTAFSAVPLIAISRFGLLLTAFAFLASIAVILQRLFNQDIQLGWASLIVSIWLLGGIIIFSIGIVGIYLAQVFVEVKNRPYTITRDVYRRASDEKDV